MPGPDLADKAFCLLENMHNTNMANTNTQTTERIMGNEKNIEWALDIVLQLAQERVVKLAESRKWDTEVKAEIQEMFEAITMVTEFDFDSPECF